MLLRPWWPPLPQQEVLLCKISPYKGQVDLFRWHSSSKLIPMNITPALLRYKCKGDYGRPCYFFNCMLWVSSTPNCISLNVYLAHWHSLWQIWNRRSFTPSHSLSIWNGILEGESVQWLSYKKGITLTPTEFTHCFGFSRYLFFLIVLTRRQTATHTSHSITF